MSVLNKSHCFLKVEIVERACPQLRYFLDEVVAAWPQSLQKPELALVEVVVSLDLEVLV
jgi:hypothetical protein